MKSGAEREDDDMCEEAKKIKSKRRNFDTVSFQRSVHFPPTGSVVPFFVSLALPLPFLPEFFFCLICRTTE